MFFLKIRTKPALIYPALNNCTDWSLSVGLYTRGNSNTEYTVLLKKTCIDNLPPSGNAWRGSPTDHRASRHQNSLLFQGEDSSPESIPLEGKWLSSSFLLWSCWSLKLGPCACVASALPLSYTASTTLFKSRLESLACQDWREIVLCVS